MTNAPMNGGARSNAVDQTNASSMAPNQSEVNSVEFLEWFRPGGPWVLTAIVPDKGTNTTTFRADQKDRLAKWLAAKDGVENIYFQVNGTGDKNITKKTSKADLVSGDWLHVDVDPNPGEDLKSEREAILPRLRAFEPQPSLIIDSGGGYQAFWRLREPASADDFNDVEAANKWIAQELGGDHCHNIDRIMRLPGTTNVPTKKKKKAGRIPVPTQVVLMENTVWDWDEFGRVAQEQEANVTHDRILINELPDTLRNMAANNCNDIGEPYTDRSAGVWAFVCKAARQGVAPDVVKAALLEPNNKISAHVREQPNAERYIDRQLARAQQAALEFITNDKGQPALNLENLRIALARLNLPLWYDEFADRFWLGKEQLTDHVERNTRLVLLPQFGLRFPKGNFTDFTSQIAWENRRHPLRERLLSSEWDGQPRLETFLIDWAEAEDNDYVRTVTRLWFLAAARRVLEPGVKFDELMILESPQGSLKSSAMEKLAFGPEWFTDGLPMNGDSKVAIEQTQGKWICEVADMQGRTSDDNRLKAFLSRTTDRARLAYDRRAADVPRSWIPVGTTNDSHYLKDPTGNRRFWPIRIGRFSLDFDPQQLWAEAVARRDENIRMPKELWALAAEQQENRARTDPWEDVIVAHLDDADIVLASEVWNMVQVPVDRRRQRDNARLGGIMQRLGFERKKLRHNARPQWHYVRRDGERRYRSPDELNEDIPF